MCALASLQSHSDALICLHNADAAAVCKRRLNISHPSMHDINAVFSTQVIFRRSLVSAELVLIFLLLLPSPGLSTSASVLFPLNYSLSRRCPCRCCQRSVHIYRTFTFAQTLDIALCALGSSGCPCVRKHSLGFGCTQRLSDACL